MASGVFSNLQGVRGFEIYGSEQYRVHKQAVKYDIIGRHVLEYDSCDKLIADANFILEDMSELKIATQQLNRALFVLAAICMGSTLVSQNGLAITLCIFKRYKMKFFECYYVFALVIEFMMLVILLSAVAITFLNSVRLVAKANSL